MTPFLFSKGRDGVFLNIIELSTWVFIVLGILFWLVVRAVLSMVLQPLRRACVLEKQGLLASIIHGIKLTLHHFTEIAPLWLIWMGIRLIWVPFMVPVMILFVPFLLLTIPLGTALGGAPAAFVAAIAYGFMDGATPWILGIIAGLPIFILVVISPLLFLSGLVEVYLSSIWTLGYRDMNAMDQNVQEPIIETQALAAPSKA
jgi:hypothetical protein